jgi:hypothetical protein
MVLTVLTCWGVHQVGRFPDRVWHSSHWPGVSPYHTTDCIDQLGGGVSGRRSSWRMRGGTDARQGPAGPSEPAVAALGGWR